mmetsp:Transcript_44266/g.134826  ORF Transcript_44266/g.134826 Transcript_44266/m.134826 type:complete len:218 (+) Transcript_44266:1561-2214(+)
MVHPRDTGCRMRRSPSPRRERTRRRKGGSPASSRCAAVVRERWTPARPRRSRARRIGGTQGGSPSQGSWRRRAEEHRCRCRRGTARASRGLGQNPGITRPKQKPIRASLETPREEMGQGGRKRRPAADTAKNNELAVAAGPGPERLTRCPGSGGGMTGGGRRTVPTRKPWRACKSPSGGRRPPSLPWRRLGYCLGRATQPQGVTPTPMPMLMQRRLP